MEEKSTSVRRQIARVLLVGGGVCWAGLMILIVYQSMKHGIKPSPALITATVACWLIFFAGKSIIKFENQKLEKAQLEEAAKQT